MSDWPPMPAENRKDAADGLRKIARRIDAGEIYAFSLVAIDVNGRRSSAYGAAYNSDIAIMARAFLADAMVCECGQAGCPTDIARMAAVDILTAYLNADDTPRKGN